MQVHSLHRKKVALLSLAKCCQEQIRANRLQIEKKTGKAVIKSFSKSDGLNVASSILCLIS